jgi:hypothetical protein
MEYWNIVKKSKIKAFGFHLPIIPLFHYSIIPTLLFFKMKKGRAYADL